MHCRDLIVVREGDAEAATDALQLDTHARRLRLRRTSTNHVVIVVVVVVIVVIGVDLAGALPLVLTGDGNGGLTGDAAGGQRPGA
jgi:hypothetical protein